MSDLEKDTVETVDEIPTEAVASCSYKAPKLALIAVLVSAILPLYNLLFYFGKSVFNILRYGFTVEAVIADSVSVFQAIFLLVGVAGLVLGMLKNNKIFLAVGCGIFALCSGLINFVTALAFIAVALYFILNGKVFNSKIKSIAAIVGGASYVLIQFVLFCLNVVGFVQMLGYSGIATSDIAFGVLAVLQILVAIIAFAGAFIGLFLYTPYKNQPAAEEEAPVEEVIVEETVAVEAPATEAAAEEAPADEE